MDNQVTRQLLDKYFEGETSLQEERQLRQAFQQEGLPEDLQPFQPLFRYLQHEQQDAGLSEGFEERLLQQLEPEPPSATVRRMQPYRWVLRIAAAVLLALGVYGVCQLTAEEKPAVAGIDWSKYEVQEPEEAFRLTQAALLKASSELNQGTSVAAKEFDSKLKRVGEYLGGK